MGEIADSMLEGDTCEMCGVALDGEGYGIPRYCSNACAQDRGYDCVAPDGAGMYSSSPAVQYKKSKTAKPKFADTTHELVVKVFYGGQPLIKSVNPNIDLEGALAYAQSLIGDMEDRELDFKTGPLMGKDKK